MIMLTSCTIRGEEHSNVSLKSGKEKKKILGVIFAYSIRNVVLLKTIGMFIDVNNILVQSYV